MADETTINIGAPSVYERREEDPYSSDTTKALSPAQTANAAASESLAKEEIAGTAVKAQHDKALAQIAADDAATKERIGGGVRAERVAVDEAHSANIAARAEVLRQANEEYRKAPPPSLFSDGAKGWNGVAEVIALAVAGFGDAMGARAAARLGQAKGPSAVDGIIKMELDRQREALAKLKDHQLIAKEGVADARLARDQALARVDLKGAAMYGAAADHMEKLLKAKGVDAPEVAQNAEILKLKRSEEDRKTAAVAGLTSEHTRVGAKTETVNRTPADTSSARGLAMVKNADGSDAGPAPAAAAAETNKATVLRVNAVKAANHFQELAAKVGGRALDPSSTEYQELQAAHADLVAAVTSVTNMPGTDRSSLVEAERMGPSGVGVSWKVNPVVIRRLAESIRDQGENAIKMTANTALTVSKSGQAGRPTPPAQAASDVTGAPATAPATQPMIPPRKPNSAFDDEQKEAVRWIAAHPNDPRVPAMKKRLGL